jgi:malate dehydrogenase
VGVPVKLGAGGVEQVIEIKLLPEEKEAFQKSVDAVKNLVRKINV